jgi:hypothetical protein
MMAKFQEGVLRGSSKTTSDSPKRTRLSITFFLEDRAIISKIVSGRSRRSFQKVFERFKDDFQVFSGTSYVRFQLSSKLGTYASGVQISKTRQ